MPPQLPLHTPKPRELVPREQGICSREDADWVRSAFFYLLVDLSILLLPSHHGNIKSTHPGVQVTPLAGVSPPFPCICSHLPHPSRYQALEQPSLHGKAAVHIIQERFVYNRTELSFGDLF